MVNVPKLKGRMVEQGYTQKSLAAALEMDITTLNRKVNNVEGSVLSVKEVTQMARLLRITSLQEYFFCDNVAETQPDAGKEEQE